ncbi:MAG: LacI family DNA-binding transcriptional regulator [Agromyces sp.]
MSSIAEIAELLGLSKSTVSRALRGQPGISQATVAAVRDLAEELGYVPSATAVGLATGRHRAIGVVVPSVQRWFYTSALTGIDRALADSGYDVVLYDLAQSGRERRMFQSGQLRSRVDAIVVLSIDFTVDEWEDLLTVGMPVITVGAPTPGIRRIGVDDYQIGRVVTERVLDFGHERIAHLGGMDPQALIETSVNDRERAFRDVLTENRIPIREDWILSGGYRSSISKLVTEDLLATGDVPTALVCASDEMALGAMYAISAAGLTVGRDISVIGIDGHEYAEAYGLSTVQQFPDEQGAMAAETLVAELDGRPPRTSFVPARWVLLDRESLGQAPG